MALFLCPPAQLEVGSSAALSNDAQNLTRVVGRILLNCEEAFNQLNYIGGMVLAEFAPGKFRIGVPVTHLL